MWTHKKHKGEFKGSYEKDKRGERVFVLSNGKRNVSFESYQAAISLGWSKK